METPLEIVFHNMPSSPQVEAEIREQVTKLERRFGRLTACRVSVELLHRQHQTGNIHDVHITMRVPRGELVVSREPHRPKQKYAEPDIRISLRDAFKAAERQLTEYKRKLTGEVKPHEEAFAGQISQIYPNEDHGFILTHEGTQLYFHRNSLIKGDFARLRVGEGVHFIETVGDTGPIASKVWSAGEPG
jgi:ribosome-associated translation inhibitor RaiA/cold shock CspA family protein